MKSAEVLPERRYLSLRFLKESTLSEVLTAIRKPFHDVGFYTQKLFAPFVNARFELGYVLFKKNMNSKGIPWEIQLEIPGNHVVALGGLETPGIERSEEVEFGFHCTQCRDQHICDHVVTLMPE